jgi:photosystem II stability/assembly factor-like uncharacterized protein
MKRNLLLVFLFGLMNLPGFSQWTWRNPLPQGNNLYTIWGQNPDTLYAGGSIGTVMRTTDGGQNWTIWNLINDKYKSVYFIAVTFPDANTGYAVDKYGFVYKTVNGGVSWDSIYYEETEYLYGASFMDTDHGVIVGSGGKIIRTSDGGASWQFENYPSGDDLTAVSFPSQQVGYIAGSNGLVLKTTNGGNNWVKVHGDSSYFNSCCFISLSTGVACGYSGKVVITTDGGNTWVNHSVGDTVYCISVSMFNENKIIISGTRPGLYSNQYIILKSDDQGSTWNTIVPDDPIFCPQGVKCFPDGTAWCVGWGGYLARSSDFGITWIPQTTYLSRAKDRVTLISGIDFPSAETGYFSTTMYEGLGGTVIKTTDGGDTWFNPDTSFSSHSLYSVRFLTPEHGFVATGDSIFATYDGGTSWNLVWSEVPIYWREIRSIDFANDVLGFAVGAYGIVLKTLDMGQTWALLTNLPQDYNYKCVSFPDPSAGYVIGYDTIFKTVDQGNSWTRTHTPIYLYDIFFLDSQVGFGVGYGKIIKTTDGAQTWTELVSPTTDPLNTVKFYDADTGFIAGGLSYVTSFIYKTVDGGLSWHEQTVPTNYPITSFCITPGYKAYAAGSTNLFGTTNGGGTITGTKEPPVAVNPVNVSTYPNPSDNIVTIAYTVTERSLVKIDLFNSSGRYLGTLANETRDPGNYSLRVNAENYPPGLYFFRVGTGNASSSGKFVISHP